MTAGATTWHKTACVLCSVNCGIEIEVGADGRRFERIRGDRAHPASQGYHCEKALRLDHYQNGRDRLTHPLRRRDDGSFERIDWDTAIREVAARLAAVRETHGGERILYYGGGGQGNHLCGVYASATRRALGVKYRSNALAQEKTGWAWVNEQTVGGFVAGDFEHCEVALFVGKNPWHSHGVPRARSVLREIANDPARTLIVVDPRRTETAELADIHLRLKPGTDAWLLAALAGVIVQEDLIARRWLDEHATGVDEVLAALRAIPVASYAAIAGVPHHLVRTTARRLATARSVAAFEDLGTQMTRHSTLNSYLDNLLWLLTGNFAKPGANNLPLPLIPIAPSTSKPAERSPVAKAPILAGLVPCNVIADEILSEHPDRYRAMIVESANPAHSLADSPRLRAALDALECVVVIDVAMTETARLADYVLPTPSQFEKWEATFFNFEAPANYFHLRRPVLEPPPGSDLLPEPEIHARLCEALGAVTETDLVPLRDAARRGRAEFAAGFVAATTARPKLGELAPVILYRTLGPTLPDGAAAAAVLWGATQRMALRYPAAIRRAGIDAPDHALGDALFDMILAGRSGVVFAVDSHEDTWRRLRALNGKVNLHVPELVTELALLGTEPPASDPAFPFVLSAGERRSFTANAVYRDPAWRKKDPAGALRINPEDAGRLGLADGDAARVTTRRGSMTVAVEISDTMQAGHVSLPNGLGVDYPGAGGNLVVTGTPPNELTASDDRDWFAGTPWHKHVPARVEAVGG